MKIHFYSPVHFEKWDLSTPDRTGIGGSETSHIELSRRLARMGHEVHSYSPLPEGRLDYISNVIQHDLSDADFSEPGLWVLYRCPPVIDAFGPLREDQPRWLVCQDVGYGPDGHREDRMAKFDRVLAHCCKQKADLLLAYPWIADKVLISNNGVRTDLMRSVWEEKKPERNPKRLIYASSPDRGLDHLLWIFQRAIEYVPDLELVVCYGFQNLDKLKHAKPTAERIKNLISQAQERCGDRIRVTGRLTQPELYEEWFRAGIWCYPSGFPETPGIVGMESQAMGAIPITNPIWGIGEKVRHGVFIQGDPSDPLTRCRYVASIVRVAMDVGLQNQIRSDMMRWSQGTYSWERVAEMHDSWIRDHDCRPPVGDEHQMPVSQYYFQKRHARGKTLNVGCDIDPCNFGSWAVNVDVTPVSPVTGMQNKAHVLADARNPLPFGEVFDTVLLGDILEHMVDGDATAAVANAKAVLRPGGRVVITVPDDRSNPWEQHGGRPLPNAEYAPGVSAYHDRPIELSTMVGWAENAKMKVVEYRELDYGFASGWGAVLEAA